jgi:hypothetical protein
MRVPVKATTIWSLVGVLVIAMTALYFGWYREYSRREAFIYRCNEEGEGGMFTSREYCEELYARSSKAN